MHLGDAHIIWPETRLSISALRRQGGEMLVRRQGIARASCLDHRRQHANGAILADAQPP